MLFAAGWCVVRSSRLDYDHAPTPTPEDITLWDDLEAWLSDNTGDGADPWLRWTFTRELNNTHGVLQFWASRNHRTSAMWDLLDWLVGHAPHSFGLVHVHDDEDGLGHTSRGRGQADHSNEFRVWRILNGRLEEFPDTLLSPFVPTIEDPV